MKTVFFAAVAAMSLAACSQEPSAQTSAASAAGTQKYELTEGSKLLTRFFLKQDINDYFQRKPNTAFDDDQPLFDVAQLPKEVAAHAAEFTDNAFGLSGKINQANPQTLVFNTSDGIVTAKLAAAPTQALKSGEQANMVCTDAHADAQGVTADNCLLANDFIQTFPEQVFQAIDTRKIDNPKHADEAMAVKLIPFLAAAEAFTGNYKACETTLTEECVARIAREMPEKAVRAKAQELGLLAEAFKGK